MAQYELDFPYIKTSDFTDNASINFEPISSVLRDDEDYSRSFNYFVSLSDKIAEDYLKMIFLDTVCMNMDRHTKNYGVFRDINTGEIFSLAPNYDNNIALIARGIPVNITRETDGMLRFFFEFLSQNPTVCQIFHTLRLPCITSNMIHECIAAIPISVDEEKITTFVLSGQKRIQDFMAEL